jgi:hypothetical protein
MTLVCTKLRMFCACRQNIYHLTLLALRLCTGSYAATRACGILGCTHVITCNLSVAQGSVVARSCPKATLLCPHCWFAHFPVAGKSCLPMSPKWKCYISRLCILHIRAMPRWSISEYYLKSHSGPSSMATFLLSTSTHRFRNGAPQNYLSSNDSSCCTTHMQPLTTPMFPQHLL